MNILIVGNGFDLSHYLPTKYDHFMVAMEAIESWDVSKGEMNFDDLFGSLYEKEGYFFGYTKAMYKTDELKISVAQIEKLKAQLKENVWYQYFSDHVREVKTWIDFELKIQQALMIVFNFFEKIEDLQKNTDWFGLNIMHSGSKDYNNVILRKNESYILSILNILKGSFYYSEPVDDIKLWMGDKRYEVYRTEKWNESIYKLNEIYIINYKSYNEFKFQSVIKDLNVNLDDFIFLFRWYLVIVEGLNNKKMLKKIDTIQNSNLSKIYSFNYTKTSAKLYGISNIDFLHGAVESSNIVLGVSDLDIKILEKYNFYRFVKYHQKLINDTHYNFILEDEIVMGLIRNARGDFYKDGYELNIIIWGHSLDRSDENYIKEIFSLNEKRDEQVKIIVYYFNKNAYFELLSNLILILSKEKIELWMKKGWLKFEKNPDIAKINGIEPVELPKIIAQVS